MQAEVILTVKYSVTVNQEKRFIIASVEGKWRVEESDKLTKEMVALARKYGFSSALIDHRKLKINMSTLLAFRRPTQLKEFFSGLNPKVAFLYPEGKESLYSFIESVAQNRGINFRIFRHEDDAITWLTD